MPGIYTWHDLLGNIGFLLIVGSYFLLQVGRVSGNSPAYALTNAGGAALVLVSLYFDFNLSAALVEFFWLVISLMGPAIRFWKRASVLGPTCEPVLGEDEPGR